MRSCLALFLLFSCCHLLSAQSILGAGNYAAISNGANSVVKGPGGLLHAVVIEETPTGDRPVLIKTSIDGGLTWSTAPAPMNDATSGLSGTNRANTTSMAIDSLGTLHVIWGIYSYPSYYQQFYRSYDPIGGTLSPIINMSNLQGAGLGVRTAGMDIAVDGNDIVWLTSHGTSGSWREHLVRSTNPLAAGQTFTDLGAISVSASAQTTRLCVDINGNVHCSYYRNTGNGEYWTRMYSATSGWQTSFRLGNTAPTNDFYGNVCSDGLGNVHAVYLIDSHNTSSNWGLRYRRWDATGGWASEVIIDDIPSSAFSGVATTYTIFAAACDELTGTAFVYYWDLNNGGALTLVSKDLVSSSFIPLAVVAGPSVTTNSFIQLTTRGRLNPPSDNTGTDLGVTWRQPGLTTTHEYVYASIGASAGPTIQITAPAIIGQVATIYLSSPGDGGKGYACAFSTGTTPGYTLPGGSHLDLNADALFWFSLTPNNGIFFNNIGTLSTSDDATVVVQVPLQPSIVGATIYTAFAVADPAQPGGVGTVSSAIPVLIQ